MKSTELHERVAAYLQRRGISSASRILAACSGGPDSTALLHVLLRLREATGYSLACMHLDHGLRPREETDAEIALLEELARLWDVELVAERLQSGELESAATDSRTSVENAARAKRYERLYATADRLLCTHVATGHTLDDQVETLLMRVLQGSSIRGLSGIPDDSPRLLRPLLAVSGEALSRYLEEQGIPYRIDASNLERDYLRNRVRLDLVPMVRDIFPGYRTGLSRLAEKMRCAEDFVDRELSARIRWERVDSDRFRIDGETFVDQPGFLRLESLYGLCDRLLRDDLVRKPAGSAIRVPYRFLSPVSDDAWFYPKRTLLSGHGVVLRWAGRWLFLEREVVSPNEKGYFIQVEREGIFTAARCGLEVRVTRGGATPRAKGTLVTDKCALHFPLVIRSRRPGDQIETISGRKSLKKLFNEWTVPPRERWRVPVVEHRDGILAVLGGAVGFRDRISKVMKSMERDGEIDYTITIEAKDP